MEKLALKISGIVFVLIAVLHGARVAMLLPATVGDMYIPLRVSAFLAVAALALGAWLLKLACCECCKKG